MPHEPQTACAAGCRQPRAGHGKKFHADKTCIAWPLFHGSSFFEFSCGKGAFVEGDASLPKNCPFCDRPVNSLTSVEVSRDG